MLNFFTFVSFIIAVVKGSWFWLLFIIMLCIWAKKDNAEKAEASKKDTSVIIPHPPQTSDKEGNIRPTILSKSNNWIIQLTEICEEFSGRDYYVEELIPLKKLENAKKSYPVPDGGRVIALIDCTVMGSAKNGMAIGEHGLSWHNDWTTESKQTSLPWIEFSTVSIDHEESGKVNIGTGNKFDISGCTFGQDNIINLLKKIQQAVKTRNPIVEPRQSQGPVAIDVNIADFDLLITLPGIGAAEAHLLLNHRKTGKVLISIDEMADLLNLKPHIAKRLEEQVFFSKLKLVPNHTPFAIESQPPPPQAIPTGRGRAID
jgi:hypothetical protein